MQPRSLQNILDENLPPKHPDSAMINLQYNFSVRYHFSNDEGWELALANLPQQNQNSSGLFVGESNWLSVLPELTKSNIKTLFFADFDPEIHEHIALMKKTIENSINRAEFFKNYTNALSQSSLSLNDSFKGQFEFRANSPAFFLSSEERYLSCKKALSEIEVFYVGIDITNVDECQTLSKILQQHPYPLNLINITNLEDYCDRQLLQKNIRTLIPNQNINNVNVLLSSEGESKIKLMALEQYFNLKAQEEKNNIDEGFSLKKNLRECLQYSAELKKFSFLKNQTTFTKTECATLAQFRNQIWQYRAIAFHLSSNSLLNNNEQKKATKAWNRFQKWHEFIESSNIKEILLQQENPFRMWKNIKKLISSPTTLETKKSEATIPIKHSS